MSILTNVETRLATANEIIERLSLLKIEGVSKLSNKFKQEINFLQKCVFKKNIKQEHLICSNLTHLEAVANQVLKCENICTSVMNQKVLTNEIGLTKKICVDLILHGGSVWVKVIARNKRALTLVSKGDCSFGQKSVIDQAFEFLECSSQNSRYFRPPTVVFFFANGIEETLASDLTSLGIKVDQRTPNSDDFNVLPPRQPLRECDRPRVEDLNTLHDVDVINDLGIKKLNLGVTTMIAYVSALTNGGSDYSFHSEILQKHAEWEKIRPVKQILDKLFEGKELYSCRTAVNDFKGILDILGGAGERERGKKLLERVIVVDDHPTSKLLPGGRIKERSIAIFGTGEYLEALTVTANHAFIRSAKNKGVKFEVFLHESRALTEGKQLP